MSKTKRELVRGEPPKGYKTGNRVSDGCGCYLVLNDQVAAWKNVNGCFCEAAPFQKRIRMTRPTAIRLVWPQGTGMSDAEEARRWGWWPARDKTPPAVVPHFAVDQAGEVVQFLDPFSCGSAFMANFADGIHPPSQTIVIAAMAPTYYPTLAPTPAQRKAADALIDMLQVGYFRPKVQESDRWQRQPA